MSGISNGCLQFWVIKGMRIIILVTRDGNCLVFERANCDRVKQFIFIMEHNVPVN